MPCNQVAFLQQTKIHHFADKKRRLDTPHRTKKSWGGVKQTKALLFIDFFRRNRLYSHKKMLTLRSYIALKSVFKETDLSYMRFYTYITLFKKPI